MASPRCRGSILYSPGLAQISDIIHIGCACFFYRRARLCFEFLKRDFAALAGERIAGSFRDILCAYTLGKFAMLKFKIYGVALSGGLVDDVKFFHFNSPFCPPFAGRARRVVLDRPNETVSPENILVYAIQRVPLRG